MFQIVYEYQKPWPEEGVLRLEAQFESEIRVSPTIAERRARGFLAGHVLMMVVTGTPALIAGEQPVWRVPAHLHLPGFEEAILVGAIDVDALTGEIIPPSSDQISAMQQRAHDLAARFASSPAPAG